MRQTVSFDSRIACLKYGMGDAPCTVVGRNYYPPWGSVVDRKFISSGTQVSLQYVGRPIDDYFEIIFTPSESYTPSYYLTIFMLYPLIKLLGELPKRGYVYVLHVRGLRMTMYIVQ